MKGTCVKCGCKYTFTPEEEDLYLTGNLEREICDECFMEEEENCFCENHSFDEFSDADPGL